MAWRFYRHLLQTHPVKVKALTSSFITGVSDVGLQFYQHNSNDEVSMQRENRGVEDGTMRLSAAGMSMDIPSLQWSRTTTLAAVGLLYSGPVNHMWFAVLEKLVKTQHHARTVMLKLFLDQIFFAPVVISGYLTVRGILERKTEHEISAQLQEKVTVATRAAWQFWPFVNLIAFSVVPVMYRVLFGNFCAIFWNAKLSLISSQTSHATEAKSTSAGNSMSDVSHTVAIESQKIGLALGSLMSAVMFELYEQATEELPLYELGYYLCSECQASQFISSCCESCCCMMSTVKH